MSGGMRTVERWGVFELPVAGPEVEAVFSDGERRFTAAAFTGADGGHAVRFMPDREGEWSYGAGAGDADAGVFTCVPPAAGNHGPVVVAGARFAYADGQPFHPVSTAVGEAGPATRRALAAAPFNRVRLLASASLPLDRLVEQVAGLRELGIEAEVDLGGRRDVAETVSRLAAYRNVWWRAPQDADVQTVIRDYDYGHHLLTVHGGPETDFGAPWITHVSVALEDTRAVAALSGQLGKPVMVDDCGAEGDAPVPERSLPGAELLARLWEGLCQGGYATHAESYGTSPWTTHGGRFSGEAPDRIAFLSHILDDAPPGLVHNPAYYDASTLELPGEYVLQYLGAHRYPYRRFELAEGTWRAEVLDTWNMRVGAPRYVSGGSGRVQVELPGEPYCAVRIRRVPADPGRATRIRRIPGA
ncbi:DUF5605 domain-containing protein [Streptomyces boninensis]|uniref:DUF5605 domain-containing protein n=1 Tax=Streptomyces boninensis TaxID=2039455 RepID=UPI003B21B805